MRFDHPEYIMKTRGHETAKAPLIFLVLTIFPTFLECSGEVQDQLETVGSNVTAHLTSFSHSKPVKIILRVLFVWRN